MSVMKVTILYTPQCPSNLYFVETIRGMAAPYPVEAVNVHEEYEKVRELMEESGVGSVRNLFIRVYLDGKLVPIHPGNPRFKEILTEALEASL
jgi:hypothetical protein